MSKTLRRWITSLALILLVCLAGALVACGGEQEPEEPPATASTFTIVFDSTGGGSVSDRTWTEGTTLSLPTPGAGSSIEMYGYTFVGWFYDEACTKAVDKANFDVGYAKDGVITLYAGWSNLHYIYFDTKTSESIEPVQYAYNSVISVDELPQPPARTVGTTVCKFLYWIQTNTGTAVTEDFKMDAQDMYFYAYYDTGTNLRFELNDEGYYVPTGTNTTTTQSRYRDYTLQDGQVYSVDMTLPADWSTYSDDSGPVFSAIHFDEAGTTFNNGHYIVMFISCKKNANGAIEFWGTADVNGSAKNLQLIARYKLDGSVLKNTPYYNKMTAYQESDEEETFALTYRRSDGADGITWYVGIDGVEYFRLTTGQTPYPKADLGNLTVSTALAATDDDGNVGSLVGLRAKTLGVKYSNLAVTDYSGVEVTFDAGSGTLEGETTRAYAYGTPVALPTPVKAGYEFAGWWYTTDYTLGTTAQLLEGTTYDSSVWKIFVTAQWRKEGALPYTVRFDTGAEGNTVADLTDWYEGNRIVAPVLEVYLGKSYLYIYSGSWYYDAACTDVADLSNVDPARAVASGEGGRTITLYAGCEKLALFEGAGTQESPYLIQSESDFVTLYRMVGYGYSLAKNYLRLEADIALTGEWKPIGTASKPFSGTLDGNGKTITGLTVNTTEGFAAMFGYTSGATVKNLDLTVSIKGGKTYTAGLIAYSAGTTLIENCVLRGSVTGTDSVGGFIGSCYTVTVVKNCVNYADITATNTIGATIAGGIVGGTTNAVTVERCANYGTVSSTGGMIGGIVGILRSHARAVVTLCLNFGNVTGTAAVGGIVGVNRGLVSYSFCSSSVPVGGTAASGLQEVGYRTATASTGPNGYIVGQIDSKGAPSTAKEPVFCGLCDGEGKITYTLDYGYEKDGQEYVLTGTAAVGDPLPETTRPGYRFDGWYAGEETVTVFCTSRTVVAKWTKLVTVTFTEGADETLSGNRVYTVEAGSALAEYPTVTKTVNGLEYTFAGWYFADGTKATAETVFEENATLTAKWIEKITVTFSTDGGTFTSAAETGSRTLDADTPIGTLPEVSKESYNFLGWYLADGTTQVTAATAFGESVTVTAKWEQVTRYATVTFDAKGGTLANADEGSREVETGTAVGALPAVSREGYTFKGWFYTDQSGEAAQATAETLVAGTLTLYAEWLEQFTVTFNAGAGAVTGEATKKVTDGEAVGTLPTATRAGYTFIEWTLNGESVTEETVITAPVEFVAVWSVAYLLGSGTEAEPYLISNADELAFFADSVNSGEAVYNASGVYVSVTADIDMTGVAFTSIANTDANRFCGVFNGSKKLISGLTSSLFGYAGGATLKNIVVDVNISSSEANAAAIVRIVQSAATVIEGCESRGSVTGAKNIVAGIVGWVNAKLTITDCVNRAAITCNVASSFAFTGGIIGSHQSGVLTVSGCVNYGTVTAAKGTMVGGIVGIARASAGSTISGCYNYGNVTASSQVGGISGCLRVACTNCYTCSAATISGGADTGVISGQVNNGGSYKNCGTCDENGENVTLLDDKTS